VRLAVRTGVNTGEVVTGDPAIGDALVLGDAVNVAARLEQVAAPGEVLLGQSTNRLVRDAVEAERVTPLRLKGKGAPVVAYRLGRVDPGAPGHARRQDAPIVGREPEPRLFVWVYERVASTLSGHLLTVLGQAGMGRTRLVGEAVAALPGATVPRGRCLSYGEGITYWPVAEIVRQAAGIVDTDAPAEAGAKLRRLLDAGSERERDHVATRIAQLIHALQPDRRPGPRPARARPPRRGPPGGAEAVRIAEPTDLLTMHADALLDQAAVASAAARPGDARAGAQAALELYQAKGNLAGGHGAGGRARRDARLTPVGAELSAPRAGRNGGAGPGRGTRPAPRPVRRAGRGR
jgi:AAA ATPase domain/Adenylate and Guanylate cyclase catalytic domain